jgi:hypothetical protein
MKDIDLRRPKVPFFDCTSWQRLQESRVVDAIVLPTTDAAKEVFERAGCVYVRDNLYRSMSE